MKTIALVRHAKADNPENTIDYNRPLTNEGDLEAIKVAQFAFNIGFRSDIIISSAALRAISTAHHFAQVFEYDSKNIKQEEEIYSIGKSFILNILQKLPNSANSVMVVGHNPDITATLAYLTGETGVIMQTAAFAWIEAKIDNWEAIGARIGTLKQYFHPKGI